MKNTKINWVLGGIALLILPLVLQYFGNAWVRIADLALLYVMLALGLNIVVGYAGLLDLGYVAFYAVGAYLFGLMASPHLADNFAAFAAMFPNGLHTSLWLVIPLAAVLAAFFGGLLGAPTLKLRGDYLAIVTLGFGEIIRIFLNNLDHPVNLTNGPKGIGQIDSVKIFGLDLGKRLELFGYDINSVTLYYYLFLILVIFTVVICYRLQDSRIGRAWMAIREDEIAAKAMGINTRNMKLLAFGMGASFGGVSGAMFGAFQGFVSPESFSLMESVMIVAMVVLGGIGHMPGCHPGAVLLSALPEVLRYVAGPLQDMTDGRLDSAILRQLLIALAMIVIMLMRPRGLWPSPEHGKSLTKDLNPSKESEHEQIPTYLLKSQVFPSALAACKPSAMWASPSTRSGLWPDRPQRCWQDHVFQRDHRPVHPDSGTFELAGKPYEPTAVHEVAKAGIARTFQNIRLFAEMTALENVMVGRHIRTHSGLLGAVLRTAKSFQGRRGCHCQAFAGIAGLRGHWQVCGLQGPHPELWRPAPPGNCPSPGDRPAADCAG
jgi:branched-chain amino acid transport system permease protein